MMDDVTQIVERLRVDVFYGDARQANMKRHNPLHMQAADTITALAERVCELEAAAAIRALPDGWRPIEEAPTDESILCAVNVVHNKTDASWWEMHVIQIDSETGEIHSDNDAGWAAQDYSHFMPLPAPPEGYDPASKTTGDLIR